ncbi:hypothetical protein B0H11DRAFT_1311634 [Mycena galericulata]|nr:hypothetical protein B0H11DRAFT_1311634 [Mycena galericulata]
MHSVDVDHLQIKHAQILPPSPSVSQRQGLRTGERGCPGMESWMDGAALPAPRLGERVGWLGGAPAGNAPPCNIIPTANRYTLVYYRVLSVVHHSGMTRAIGHGTGAALGVASCGIRRSTSWRGLGRVFGAMVPNQIHNDDPGRGFQCLGTGR